MPIAPMKARFPCPSGSEPPGRGNAHLIGMSRGICLSCQAILSKRDNNSGHIVIIDLDGDRFCSILINIEICGISAVINVG